MCCTKWLTWCGLGIAALSSTLALAPAPAIGGDTRTNVLPAVVRTADDAGTTVPMQQVGWRRGWAGPGYYHGGAYYGPGAGVYGGPRYYARPYYARPYYGAYYGGYYGGYPAYGYGYGYGYRPYGYW